MKQHYLFSTLAFGIFLRFHAKVNAFASVRAKVNAFASVRPPIVRSLKFQPRLAPASIVYLPVSPYCLRSTTSDRTEEITDSDTLKIEERKLTNRFETGAPEMMYLADLDFPKDDVSHGAAIVTNKRKTNSDKEKVLEMAALGTWIAGLSAFLLFNNFIGPWPADLLQSTPVQYFGLVHALAGMLFGGGIILTTLIEWFASASKNPSVLKFWFGKVPTLDSLVVLPALTGSIISGVGLAVDHYDSLGQSPIHVVGAISTLLAFAGWWAVTDLTTQSAANEAVVEWAESEDPASVDIPNILQLRKISNTVSCLFVTAIYAIMVLKPGYTP